jgi:hypothetical protein
MEEPHFFWYPVHPTVPGTVPSLPVQVSTRYSTPNGMEYSVLVHRHQPIRLEY